MRKPGTDPDNVRMSDVLCDFCHREWTLEVPVIEGHQGSIICSKCVTVACRQVINDQTPTFEPDAESFACTMCLESARNDGGWQSPAYPQACICMRCILLAAEALESDAESLWKRPQK